MTGFADSDDAVPEDDEWPEDDDSSADEPGLEDDEATSTHDVDDDASPAADTYWSISRTPLTSLVFSLPLVLAYEGGVLLLGRGSPRNGADVWLRTLLDHLGFGQYFLLPVLTILGLLAWHYVEHDRWRWSTAVLVAMAGECVLWATALIGIGQIQGGFWPIAMAGGEGFFARLIAYCGAGLYEEVLFRLMLLPAIAWLLALLGASRWVAVVWAVIVSSVLFSGAHYVGPLGDVFDPYSFTFRFLAGVFFAWLFCVRGFGIAAGTHAAYDMLVGLG